VVGFDGRCAIDRGPPDGSAFTHHRENAEAGEAVSICTQRMCIGGISMAAGTR